MGDERWPEAGTKLPPESEATQIIEPVDADESSSTNGARSLVDTLRAIREEHAADHALDLEVPGWRGLLGIRLGTIPAAQLGRIAERTTRSKQPDAALIGNVDTLIAACTGVLGRKSRGDEWEVISDGLDEGLATLLGLEASRARDVLHALYAGANAPEPALLDAGAEYGRWASEVNAEIDEATAGES